MRTGWALAVLLAAVAAGPACAQDFGQPPPPPTPYESIPPSPGPLYHWVPGRWLWDGTTWHWRHGRFASTLRYRDMYVAGHWQAHDGTGFTWVPGHMK